MILVLSELKLGRNWFEKTLSPKELDLPHEDPAFDERVSVTLEAIKQVNLVELRIHASTTSRMICSRCGEAFTTPLEGSAFYIIRMGQESMTREKLLSDEDILTLFTTETEIDTLPLIREVLLLEVPMRPLCREDCQGLCPMCGTNWNEESCPHRNQMPTPRQPLASLADLWETIQIQNKTNKNKEKS